MIECTLTNKNVRYYCAHLVNFDTWLVPLDQSYQVTLYTLEHTKALRGMN